jgi:membrane-associated HD superfamily phosphohydrolase
MNIFRTILIGLASLIFMIALTGFVYVFTLQTTIMDRTVVKGWLNESKLYDGRIIDTLVEATNAGGGQNGAPQPAANTLSASPEAIKTALNATFTPQFTQTQIEGVVNNAYDWIDGSSSEFAFSIPIDQKRDTLVAELSKAIEPQILALPVCQEFRATAPQSICRPSNMTVEQLANQLTAQSIDESGAFAKPITNESFSKPKQNTTQQPQQTSLSQLPVINKAIDMLLLALPVAAIISLGAIILATASGHRLARIARLSRRVFFAMLFIFLPTILVVWIAKDNDFGLSSLFAAQTGELVIPLIKTIAVGILCHLALITGIIAGISATTWIAFNIWQRKAQPITVTESPISMPPAEPV